ncbi:unannotated protein [freshwater metagenome]|uniref:Unannotated protein n=1 Tax=freshwater metagenome TaxID=449393 RepID=A0A6J6IF52_9ZZZZ
MVLRQRVTDRSGAAAVMRSRALMIRAAAATISGVRAPFTPRCHSDAKLEERTSSRSSPTVSDRSFANSSRSRESTIRPVTSSSRSGSSRKALSGTSARAIFAATRSRSELAAIPARRSPALGSFARAMSSRRSRKLNVSPRRVTERFTRPPDRPELFAQTKE